MSQEQNRPILLCSRKILFIFTLTVSRQTKNLVDSDSNNINSKPLPEKSFANMEDTEIDADEVEKEKRIEEREEADVRA